MSIQLVAWALEQKTGSVSRKAVLIALANCHNHHTGLCCPSIRRIRAETECSESTVLRSLMDLETAGFIVREQRRRPNGSKTTTVYRFPHSEGGYPQGDGTPTPTVKGLEPEVRTGREPNLAASPRNGHPPRRTKADLNAIWDAFTDIFGPVTTANGDTLRGRLVQELAAAGATPEEMVARAKTWPQHFDSATLTAPALVKHWDTLGRKPLRRR